MSGPTQRPTPRPGPRLVRGADVVAGGDGELHVVRRPVVALCTCDRSRLAPWCDSTHKLLRRDADRRPAERSETEHDTEHHTEHHTEHDTDTQEAPCAP